MSNASGNVRSIEGSLIVPQSTRFAIVAGRFNAFIVDRLVDGALDALVRHGVDAKNVTVVRVPGSWEIPLVCARLARSGQLDAVIAVGAVIRGATAHFDHVAGAVARGCAAAQAETRVPIAFGVLTCDSIEQAIERAGSKAGNKGFDAALAAIEMVSVGKALDDAGF
jgi:6,7-dimethyl-8-ribityllumazine synthase